MRRRLLNLLTALSVLLFVAAAGLCARSFFSGDEAFVTRTWFSGATLRSDEWGIISDSGGIVLRHTSVSSNDPASISRIAGRRPAGLAWGVGSMRPGDLWGRRPTAGAVLSCYIYSLRTPSPGGAFAMHDVRVPYWAAGLAAIGPLARLRRRRVWRDRAARGLCPRCGYDLRATPGRCPECGTIAPAPALARSLGSTAFAEPAST